MGYEEKRSSKRVMFTPEDGVVGIFAPPADPDKKISAKIINISSGGVKISFRAMLKYNIKQGDVLVLTAINSPKSNQYVVNVDTEVRWVENDELEKEIGMGCMFLPENKAPKKSLNELIEYWYMQHID